MAPERRTALVRFVPPREFGIGRADGTGGRTRRTHHVSALRRTRDPRGRRGVLGNSTEVRPPNRRPRIEPRPGKNRSMKTELLTLAETAARLRVSSRTVRDYVRRGRLRAVRMSATAPLRFRALDVDRFVESCLTQGGGH
ncbi:MAG: helix-turn-helix domain-containing protein [Verrucomicrobia bacterium]|nr:MAG: helix-turn-helix domain-containing protein [Verrucomicrobiota bacterium]